VINYESKAVHVESKFGKSRIVDFSKSDIELFQAQLLKQKLLIRSVRLSIDEAPFCPKFALNQTPTTKKPLKCSTISGA